MSNSSDTLQEAQFLGHPKGLFILFFTEMWERFSFYGMKALLIFYLTKYHLFSDDAGYLIIGSYAALGYAAPVLGGYLADKYLGFRKAIIFGGILLVLGHIGMAFEGNAATQSVTGEIARDEFALQVFYFSLAFIIVGVGYLKANISSLVGELYTQGDNRRDSGFTIFYMGINLGSFLASILCVWLGETYGWGYGFGAAGVGMILGLITFVAGTKFFNGKGESSDVVALNKKQFGIKTEYLIYILSVFSTILVWQMVQRHKVVENILLISLSISLIFILYFGFKKVDKIARERLFSLTVLIVFSTVFWALFEQAYTSLNLFADRVLDTTFLGVQWKAGQFLSLNSLFIISLAPLFAWLWIKMGKNNPNTAIKFSLSLILVGLGFGSLMLGSNISGTGQVAAIWLVLLYLLHTMGELCLSPVGLSAVTKLSPAKIVGFMMGVWFLATASSEYIAVLLAKLSSVDKDADFMTIKTAYYDLFELLFYIGVGTGVLLLVLSPLIKKYMHGVDKELNSK